jgi:lambda repressor-like predicted transcriptional regulator
MEPKSLKDWMLDTGESLATLSAKSNIAKSKLSLLVNANERAWPDYRARIAKALKTTEDQILWPEVTTITVPVDGLTPRTNDDTPTEEDTVEVVDDEEDVTDEGEETATPEPTTQAEQNASALLKDLMGLVGAQNKQLAEGIATAISGQIQHLVPRNRTHEFATRKERSSFNPTGKKNRKLPCSVWQNQTRVNVHLLHDREIALLTELHELVTRLKQPSWKCLDGALTVRMFDNGRGDQDLALSYANRTVDQRMSLSSALVNRGVSGFEGMISVCLVDIRAEAESRRRAILNGVGMDGAA